MYYHHRLAADFDKHNTNWRCCYFINYHSRLAANCDKHHTRTQPFHLHVAAQYLSQHKPNYFSKHEWNVLCPHQQSRSWTSPRTTDYGRIANRKRVGCCRISGAVHIRPYLLFWYGLATTCIWKKLQQHVRTWFPCRGKQQQNTHESLLFKELLHLPTPKQKKEKEWRNSGSRKESFGSTKNRW